MLVVDSVVTGGPADGLLEPGDVLARLQGRVIAHFLPMEALLDNHVGQQVTLEVERGGQLLTHSILVRAAGTRHRHGTPCTAVGTPCAAGTERVWTWHACTHAC